MEQCDAALPLHPVLRTLLRVSLSHTTPLFGNTRCAGSIELALTLTPEHRIAQPQNPRTEQ